MNKFKIFIIVSSVLIVILVTTIIILLLNILGNKPSKIENTPPPLVSNPVSSPEDNTGKKIDFNGKYLNAELPNSSWRIKEFEDNTGMSDLRTDSNYVGLTGFEILKNDMVFAKFGGVDGIGAGAGCEVIYKFKDTDPAYIQPYIDFANEQNVPSPQIIDLSNSQYEEIEIFNMIARRIGTELYWNSSPSTGSFNTYCDISNEVIAFKNPFFALKTSPSVPIYGYQVAITDSVSLVDLTLLDEILQSLSYSN